MRFEGGMRRLGSGSIPLSCYAFGMRSPVLTQAVLLQTLENTIKDARVEEITVQWETSYLREFCTPCATLTSEGVLHSIKALRSTRYGTKSKRMPPYPPRLALGTCPVLMWPMPLPASTRPDGRKAL
eukprot:552338-Rhodomonas_salina.1